MIAKMSRMTKQSDTEENQETSVDHNETGNTGESSLEENVST